MSLADASGEAVAIERAQVILTMWGETKRVDLPFDGNRVVVPLDSDWPLTHLPQVFYAHLFLKGVGRVPILSEPFGWPGLPSFIDGKSGETEAAELRFQDGTSIIVLQGETKELTLRARPPEPCRVKLVDTEGNPLPGVKLSALIYWSASCHTGVLMGSEELVESVTDRAGRVRIPDGDIEYAFQIHTPHLIFDKPAPREPEFRNEAITRLQGKDATFVLRPFKPRTLEVVVAGPDGKPAAGATLFASVYPYEAIRNPWSGPLASADASGRIRVKEFYPDEYGRLFFVNADDKTIWELDPAQLPKDAPLRVDLPVPPLAE